MFNSLLFISSCTDQQPPALAIRPPPADAIRGAVIVEVFVEDGASLLGHIDDSPPVALTASTWHIDGTALVDGQHVATLQATDRAGNVTAMRLPFTTDNTPPVLTVTPTQGQQGGSMAIVVHSSEPIATISGQLLERERAFYPLGESSHRAMVGVAIQQAAGEHPLTLQATDPAGNTTALTVPIDIAATDFPRGGFIRLSGAQVAARADEPARARTRKERGDAYTVRSAEALWDGPMQRPIEGRRTSGFGRYRTYSDGQRRYHYGTDLANITGTPVHAAAAGTVLHAGWQHIFGNVVILDHGQGVSTSYNHLSAVSVEVGAQVTAGERLGAVGSTGQSTGPHLHWGLVVDGVSVDAEQWLTPQPWQ